MPDTPANKADALLAEVQRERAGQLKIFLGAAPGVGKTFAMLSAARELKRQGVDVVVGLVETHGRRETEALLDGLDVLPRRHVPYKGHALDEFDLDAALARRPRVLIVDELAHRNVPGSRHERRWQDIEELLDAGIDVYTAINIQHLESLNDLVHRITQVAVRETVPDAVFDRARDVVLVDLPPRELIERLKQGKVYLPEQAASALQQFFSASNLTALRELAVQTVADRVDSELRDQLLAHGQSGAVGIRRRVLLAVDGSDNTEYLVRVTRRIAERRQAPWTVCTVDTGRERPADTQRALNDAFELARRLGGDTAVLRGTHVVDELLAYAQRQGVSTLVIGRTRERPWARIFNRTITQQLLQRGAHFELTIVNTPQARARARQQLSGELPWHRRDLPEYGFATLVSLVAMGLAALAEYATGLADLSLIFITAVVVVAVRSRMTVAVYSALLCFLAYNFFLIDPRYTLFIEAGQGVVTVATFMVAALVCGRLANRLRTQVLMLRVANEHARALQQLGKQLAAAADEQQVYAAGVRAFAQALDCHAVLLVRPRGETALQQAHAVPAAMQLDTAAAAAADWAAAHAQPAGRYTDTLAGAEWWCVPLQVEQAVLGVVALRFPSEHDALTPEQQHLAIAMVQDVAQAAERTRLVDDLESARVQGETERLRAALLSSVSHDLRSPLSAIVGSAESLATLGDRIGADDRQALAEGILQEGQRLDRYIQNLLDMTRLGHGTLQLDRDWVGIDEIVGASVARLRKLLPDTRVDIRLADDMPLFWVHPALIEQALFNILENAARFSPKDAAIAIEGLMDGNRLVLDVIDRGPGIPQDERARIFDMFYSVERGDRGPGTGLGLTICQGMIGAHGGSVEALAGDDGIGTRVRVVVPRIEPV